MVERKFHVGLFLEETPEMGGGFQAQIALVEALLLSFGEEFQFSIFAPGYFNAKDRFSKFGVSITSYKISFFNRVQNVLAKLPLLFLALQKGPIPPKTSIDDLVDRARVDLVYFLSPSSLAQVLSASSFLFTVWDSCHRDWVEFPEVSRQMRFQVREGRYKSVLPRASAVFADTTLSRDQLIRRYGLDPERVSVLPLFPPRVLLNSGTPGEDVIQKYSLKKPFVFYPAQFWPHKNHHVILKALEIAKREGQELNAVFCGSDQGNQGFVKKLASSLGVSDRTFFLGFITEQEICQLYMQAECLVMPSFFGPSNLPPIEAVSHGCPVLCSRLPGFDEILEDGATYFDPFDPTELLSSIFHIVSNRDEARKRLTLVKERVLKNVVSSGIETLRRVFNRQREIQRLWKAGI